MSESFLKTRSQIIVGTSKTNCDDLLQRVDRLYFLMIVYCLLLLFLSYAALYVYCSLYSPTALNVYLCHGLVRSLPVHSITPCYVILFMFLLLLLMRHQ